MNTVHSDWVRNIDNVNEMQLDGIPAENFTDALDLTIRQGILRGDDPEKYSFLVRQSDDPKKYLVALRGYDPYKARRLEILIGGKDDTEDFETHGVDNGEPVQANVNSDFMASYVWSKDFNQSFAALVDAHPSGIDWDKIESMAAQLDDDDQGELADKRVDLLIIPPGEDNDILRATDSRYFIGDGHHYALAACRATPNDIRVNIHAPSGNDIHGMRVYPTFYNGHIDGKKEAGFPELKIGDPVIVMMRDAGGGFNNAKGRIEKELYQHPKNGNPVVDVKMDDDGQIITVWRPSVLPMMKSSSWDDVPYSFIKNMDNHGDPFNFKFAEDEVHENIDHETDSEDDDKLQSDKFKDEGSGKHRIVNPRALSKLSSVDFITFLDKEVEYLGNHGRIVSGPNPLVIRREDGKDVVIQ